MERDLTMATQADMRDWIKDQMAETSARFAGPTEIERWVQHAHYDIARRTRYLKREADCALVADQAEYDLSTLYVVDLEDVMVLQDGGTSYQTITPISFNDYRDAMNSNETTTTHSSTGTPSGYLYHGDSLYLYTCPSYAEDKGLKLNYAAAQVFAATTEDSTIPVQFQETVIWYGLWRMNLKQDAENVSPFYMDKYVEGVTALKAWSSGLRSSRWVESGSMRGEVGY